MTGTTSNSAAEPEPEPEPHMNGQGHVKIASSENMARKKAQQTVATGWGPGSRSAEIIANKNKADEKAQQAVADAQAVPMWSMEQRQGGSAMDQSD